MTEAETESANVRAVRSGLNPPPKPPTAASSLEAVDHYVSWWEDEFARARRTVKRRAALVTIWTSILTGLIAVLGAASAALSANPWVDVFGIATTAASATSAVLVTWNQHFHHRELWIQRSAVLHELQNLRRQYETMSRARWYNRRSPDRLARTIDRKLRSILASDLASWVKIQGAGSLDDPAAKQ